MSLKEVMAELKKGYIAAIPEKDAMIREHLHAGRMKNVHAEFHKLKGTGRTYGLPEVTELGETMEKICVSWPDQAPGLVPQALELLKQIGEAHKAGNSFDLGTSPEYRAMADLVKALGDKSGEGQS